MVKKSTPILIFFGKRVVNILISELGPVLNERSGNFTFYRVIHEFLNSIIFEKITVSKIFKIVYCSFHFTENSIKLKPPQDRILKKPLFEFLYVCKNNGF